MTKHLLPLLAVFAFVLAMVGIGTGPAAAQTICPEGKTFSGACVKPGIASAMRRQTLVYTQPKHSYTAPPMLPSEDGEYYVPRDYNELRTLFGVDNAPGCAPGFVFSGRAGGVVACQ
jgi:hypothetical protein